MPLVNFSSVDFDEIKQSIKDYLKSNSEFTDYDFEGSNLSTIIDTLAYNTYISSYNANMVSNEVFLDSATLRENVVSIARNIGYLPRSRKSARARVTFSIDVGGTPCSCNSKGWSLLFIISDFCKYIILLLCIGRHHCSCRFNWDCYI